MTLIEKAFNLVESYGGDFFGKINETILVRAEDVLDIEFPPSYRKFLRNYGCGDIAGLEFFGIIDDDFYNSSIPDAIWLTLEERKSGLSKRFVIISSSGGGGYYVLDSGAVDNNGEYPVMMYDINGQTKKVANSFGEFFFSEVSRVLEEI